MKITLLIFFIGSSLFAADFVKDKDNLPKLQVPQLSAEAKAQYWRAHAETVEARLVVTLREQKEQKAVDNLIKLCGASQLILDSTGEPVCAVKEEPTTKK